MLVSLETQWKHAKIIPFMANAMLHCHTAYLNHLGTTHSTLLPSCQIVEKLIIVEACKLIFRVDCLSHSFRWFFRQLPQTISSGVEEVQQSRLQDTQL
jgi:hypothetical protein